MGLNVFIVTAHQLLDQSIMANAGNIYQMCVLKHSYTPQYRDANMEEKLDGIKSDTKSNPQYQTYKWVALLRLRDILPNSAADSVVCKT